MVLTSEGSRESKAVLVGANTVKGPSSVRRPIKPDSLRAARKVEKSGLKRRRSKREQAGLQPFGTAMLRLGGATGVGRSRGNP